MTFKHLIIALICALLPAAAFFPKAAHAQQVRLTLSGDPPWEVQADRITALQDEKMLLADGRVRFTRGAESIEGDNARYHEETKTAELKGRVVMTSADFKIVCQRLVVNLEHNVGKIYDGTAFFPENHYYISGDEIEKTGPETFRIIQGRATSCDGPNPAWTLTGRNISVRAEGYATAEHATLSTRYFPLLYVPWIKLPVKTRRQTGFLMPNVSSSSRDGLTVTQPFYWAVSDSKDMTIYLTHMSKRGLEATIEARYNDWGGKGTYRATYLRDQNPPVIPYASPFGSTTRESRYWVRGMSDMETESGFNIKFDLDLVSDPKFLPEFEGGYTGYEATKDQYLEEFGREFAEPLDPMRKTTLQITKAVNNQHLRFALEYTDDLDDPDNMETIQRLPRIGLDMFRQNLPGTPFYFSNAAEYTYFTRKTNNTSTLKEVGHRLDIHPRLYWPIKLSRFLDLEPAVGWRETFYFPNGLEPDSGDPLAADRNYKLDSRELLDASLTATTNLIRTFDVDIGSLKKIKHWMRPEVSFSYVSDQYQGDLPYWDSLDRINPEKRIRYGMVNYLVAKMEKQSARPRGGPAGDRPESEASEYNYREFLKLGLFRSYDWVESERVLEERRTGVPLDFRRPHGPWEIDLELNLAPYFWARAHSEYDIYADTFTDHDVGVKIWDRRGDSLAIGYELHSEPYLLENRDEYEYEELRGTLNLVVNEEWSLLYEKRYSFLEKEDVESLYAIIYRPQCWSVRLELRDRPGDRTIALFVSLLGLGEVAGQSHVGRDEGYGEDEGP